MFKLLIFGGTTEGRLAAEFCEDINVCCEICVATDYGASLLPVSSKVHIGRLDCKQMSEFMLKGSYTHVLDATHPYAKEATVNIKEACIRTCLPYYRLLRERAELHGKIVETLDEVINLLNNSAENILCTLGSKAMSEMTKVKNYKERMWLRVLPADGIIESGCKLGYLSNHIIYGKGPFTVEQNINHILLSKADILVTKESGSTGGYPEKAEAALKCGIKLLTLARPQENGYSLEEIKKIIERSAEG